MDRKPDGKGVGALARPSTAAGDPQQACATDAGRELAGAFVRAGREGRAALVGYWPAGYPDPERSERALVALAEGGCDVLEVGVPFSDPVADGPVLQQAAAVALKAGTTLAVALEIAGRVRRTTGVPTVLMSYYNPLLQLGERSLARRLAELDLQGVIVPDVPVEESGPLVQALREFGRAWVALAAPTSAGRLQRIAQASDGFIYAVTRTGVTGSFGELPQEALELFRELRALTSLPVALGFGIRSEAQARACRQADGVVVGTAFVEAYQQATDGQGAQTSSPEQAVRQLARTLREALRR